MGVTTDYERVPRFMSDDADLWAGSRLLWARTTIYKRHCRSMSAACEL